MKDSKSYASVTTAVVYVPTDRTMHIHSSSGAVSVFPHYSVTKLNYCKVDEKEKKLLQNQL